MCPPPSILPAFYPKGGGDFCTVSGGVSIDTASVEGGSSVANLQTQTLCLRKPVGWDWVLQVQTVHGFHYSVDFKIKNLEPTSVATMGN